MPDSTKNPTESKSNQTDSSKEKSAFTSTGKTGNETGGKSVEEKNPTTPSTFPSVDKNTNNPEVPRTSGNVASTTRPLGSATLSDDEEREKNPRADKSVVGNTSAEARVNVESTSADTLQRIERVLRDGGMDSMSTIKSLQAIGSILDDSKKREAGEPVDNITAEQKLKEQEDSKNKTDSSVGVKK